MEVAQGSAEMDYEMQVRAEQEMLARVEQERIAGLERDREFERKVKIEQARVTRACYLMQVIGSVKIFTGEVAELELFLQRMDAAYNQIQADPLGKETENNIKGFFYSRVDLPVMIELGVSFCSEWETVKRLLKERYGGAKRSIQRSAMRVFEMQKESGETAANFARRLGEAMRKLKTKVGDSCTETQEAVWRTRIYEELAEEVLMRAVPERVKTVLRIMKPTRLEEKVAVIAEEEEDFKESARDRRPVTQGGWERVERRRTRITPRGVSPTRNRAPHFRNDRPAARPEHRTLRRKSPARGPSRSYGKPRNLACWSCNTEGHFSRDCPYIYRRDRQDRRRSNEEYRGEPMEVNAGAVRGRGRPRGSDRESSLGGSSGESETEGGSGEERGDVGRRWEKKGGPGGPSRGAAKTGSD